jgi:cytochrome c-type biogenesis protein CcmH/NrfF
MKRAILFVLAVVLLGSAVSLRADQRSEAIDKQATELYQQVFSPFCAGRSLNDCPSSKAHELKEQMRAKLEAGVAPEVILEDVFAQFGEKYRTVPAYKGFGKLVWWVPLGFVVFGLFVAIVVVLSRRASPPVSARPSATPLPSGVISDELKAQIDKELSSFD